MSAEENKRLIREMVDAINAGDTEGLLARLNPGFVRHDLSDLFPTVEGLDEGRDFVAAFTAAMPDLQITIEDMVAEDDHVVVRLSHRATHTGELLGYPPTGNQLRMAAINTYRIQDGKVAEGWYLQDALAMHRTIGASAGEG